MKSKVAEALRREQDERAAEMTPEERIELAHRLGEAAVATYAAANGVSRLEAERVFSLQRQLGRRRSACLLSLLQ